MFSADQLWEQGFRGAGVKMGVFDTGIRSDHPHVKNIRCALLPLSPPLSPPLSLPLPLFLSLFLPTSASLVGACATSQQSAASPDITHISAGGS